MLIRHSSFSRTVKLDHGDSKKMVVFDTKYRSIPVFCLTRFYDSESDVESERVKAKQPLGICGV